LRPTPPSNAFNRGVACGNVLPLTRYATSALPLPLLSATLAAGLFHAGSGRALPSSNPSNVPASHQPEMPAMALG
jgi:hypothetical protein